MITIASITADGWHGGPGPGWDGPPWPALFVLPLLLTAVVVGLVLLRGRRPAGAAHIVAERYARGEIDEDEYRRRTSELRGKAAPPTGSSS